MSDKRDKPGVNPKDFLRALLNVSREDAAEVREVADVKAKPDAQREKGGSPNADAGAS
ncbi:hypothetical protein GCM10022239_06670 [Leifsonia bigeumensis]|uniref:Uncharacterized protein n=1 Tax=Leifsonella bigeumensis TaxID=433643 RepID=A0ABP7F7I9_9MICO